jgi:transposase-like protein
VAEQIAPRLPVPDQSGRCADRLDPSRRRQHPARAPRARRPVRRRGRQGHGRPAFRIAGGAPGLAKAIAAVWNGVPVQRRTVHRHRNLLGHAPERLHEEITADYTDMVCAATAEELEDRRKAFLRKWRLRHRAVADSLEEAGDALFAVTRLPPSQWRSARTTNAIERLQEAFKRRIKTQTVLPSADTAAMLFWALLASGQINMRKVDGWQTLTASIVDRAVELAA